jgi:cytochrome c
VRTDLKPISQKVQNMKYFPGLVLSIVVGILAAASTGLAQGVPTRTGGWSVLRAEQVAGKKVFDDHCAVCHSQKHGNIVFGPSLQGVADRPAASVAGFPYSDALKKSGLVWNQDNLRKWISDPEHLVPNTLMPHVAISNPAEQVYLAAYLMQLKGPRSHEAKDAR